MSQRGIAKELGISKTTVNGILKRERREAGAGSPSEATVPATRQVYRGGGTSSIAPSLGHPKLWGCTLALQTDHPGA